MEDGVTIAAGRGGSGEGGVKFSVFSGVLPELSAEEVCEHLARHGYDGVEWRVDGEYHWRAATVDRDAARIKALCAAHGLEVAGLTSYVRPDEEEGIGRLIDACRTLGCPRFRRSATSPSAIGRAASSNGSPAGSRAPGSRRCSRSISARSSRARHWPSSCCATWTRRPSA
jgi:sugar phosphate isomerase/epimerase